MADSRINSLVDEISITDLELLVETLELVMDDPSFSTGDSQKILLSTLLKTDVIGESHSEIDYQILTPKAFKATLATTTRNGIVLLANAAGITAGTAGLVVDAEQLKAVGDLAATNLAERIIRGSYHVGDLNESTTAYTITHNMGHTDYTPNLTYYLDGGGSSTNYGLYPMFVTNKSADTMVVVIRKENDADVDIYIDWTVTA